MMCRRTTFRSYFLARLLLCLFLLVQSSMALAAPSSAPNRIDLTTSAISTSARPAAAGSPLAAPASANAPAASCTPDDCAISLPSIVVGTPRPTTPTPTTPTPTTPTPTTPTPTTPTPTTPTPTTPTPTTPTPTT